MAETLLAVYATAGGVRLCVDDDRGQYAGVTITPAEAVELANQLIETARFLSGRPAAAHDEAATLWRDE